RGFFAFFPPRLRSVSSHRLRLADRGDRARISRARTWTNQPGRIRLPSQPRAKSPRRDDAADRLSRVRQSAPRTEALFSPKANRRTPEPMNPDRMNPDPRNETPGPPDPSNAGTAEPRHPEPRPRPPEHP